MESKTVYVFFVAQLGVASKRDTMKGWDVKKLYPPNSSNTKLMDPEIKAALVFNLCTIGFVKWKLVTTVDG